VSDAKRRLEALKAPIPVPTPEELAESKAEEASREKVKLVAKVTGNFKKHPNVLAASKVGDPNLQEETVTNAAQIVNDLTNQLTGMQPSQNIGIKAVGTGTGTPAANEAAPGTQAGTSTEGTAPKPAPAQVNEIQKSDTGTQAAGTDSQVKPVDSKQESSSKKKEKKGLRKLIPF
jgi:outer membrane protein assembly factor BamD